MKEDIEHTPPPSSIPPETWRMIVRHMHSAIAIWGAAQLDHRLRWLLEEAMPHLSKTLRDKIFEGFGPLSSFSARIDVAFAFGLIDGDLRADLHKMRDLRNAFAHSPETLRLSEGKPLTILQKFSTYSPGKNSLVVYLDKYNECDKAVGSLEFRANVDWLIKQPAEKREAMLREWLESSPPPIPPPPGDSDTGAPKPPRSSQE